MKKVILILLSIVIILGLSGVMFPLISQPAGAEPASRGVTRTVIAEDFTGTWCGFCPNAAGGLKQLQDEVGVDNFVVLAWHVGDTMETTQTAARASSYGVTGYPTVWFDGAIEERGAGSVSAAYDAYKANYDTRRAKSAPLEIESGGVVSGSTASVEVQINKIDSVSGSLNLRIVLMEDDVVEGSETYDHTVREMKEQSVSSSDFPLASQMDFTIQGGWDSAKLSAAVFVQTGTNTEILQSKYEDFNGPLNQPPVISNPSKTTHSILEDVEDKTLDLNTIYSDPESDTLTFTSDATEDSDIQVTIAANGVVTLQSKLNFNGAVDIVFSATDSEYHDPLPHTIKVTVQPVNDAPVATVDNLDLMMFEDQEDSSLDLDTVFTDVDGDTVLYTVTGDNNLNVVISSDGTVFIDSTGEFHGQEVLTFIATDPSGATGTKDIMVTVKTQNDVPVILAQLEDFEIMEDEVDTSIELSQVFLDTDGDTLFYTYEKSTNIDVDVDTDGKVTLTPRQDWNGEETLTFKATDRLSPYVSEDVTVTVLAVNDAPVPEDVFELYLYEDEEFSYQFMANDIEGDSLTFELNIRSVISDLEKGKNYFFDESTGDMTITATNEMVGEYKIKLTVKDDGSPSASSDPTEITMYVENTNDQPTDVKILQPGPGATYKKGDTVLFHASADDPDLNIPDSSEVLMYRWESDKVIGIIGTGAQVSKVLEPGDHKITLKVYDSANAVTQASITITVEGDAVVIDDPSGTGSQDVESSGSINPLWWMLVAIVVVVVVVLLITFSFMRKKKPQLTQEEQQLQAYYDQLGNTGMLEPAMPQTPYNYGYPQQNMYATYPQQPVSTMPQVQAPVQPQAAVLSQPKAAEIPQLPPAAIETPVPKPKPKATLSPELANLPKTKPVTNQTLKPENPQQPKDWNWNY